MLAVVVWLLCAWVAPTVGNVCLTNTTYPYRLPSAVVSPEAYGLHFTVDLASLAITGQVEINITVHKATGCLVLHAGDHVKIDATTVRARADTGAVEATLRGIRDADGLTILQLTETLQPGQWMVDMKFHTQVNTEGPTGFFQSPLYDSPLLEGTHQNARASQWVPSTGARRFSMVDTPTNNNPMMYATQFESTYARTAFPCFDEPSLKAYFVAEFTITNVPDPVKGVDWVVLFNTPVTAVRRYKAPDGGNVLKTSFERTPVVFPTYLVAYAIGPMEHVEATMPTPGGTHDAIPTRIYVPPGKVEWAKWSLQFTVDVMQFFQKSFQNAYPLRKLDQIAVPLLGFDAMENFGMLTYGTKFLLIDPTLPKDQLSAAKKMVASVVAHELAHQWTGDTVTLPFWDQTYMNEGYARFLQYVGSMAVEPTWDLWVDPVTFLGIIPLNFYDLAFTPAMLADAIGSAQATVTEDFDGEPTLYGSQLMGIIPYGKGASINKYFYDYWGPQGFWKGLSVEVSRYPYENPTATMLAGSYGVAGNAHAPDFLQWLKQPGFPVITVDTLHSPTVTLSQTQISRHAPKQGLLWWAYLTITWQDGTDRKSMVVEMGNVTSTTVTLPTTATKILVDPSLHAYCIINYKQKDDWATWANQLRTNTSISRAQWGQALVRGVLLARMGHHTPTDIAQWFATTVQPLNQSALGGAPGVPAAAGALKTAMTLWLQVWVGLSFANDSRTDSVNDLLGSAMQSLVKADGGWGPKPSGKTDVRGVASFWAVFYRDHSAWTDAIRWIPQGWKVVPADLAQAVFWLAAQFADTYNSYVLPAYEASLTNTTAPSDAILFGMAAPPNVTGCTASFNTVKKAGDDKALALLGRMMQYNAICREYAFTEWQTLAASYLAEKQASAASLDLTTAPFTATGVFTSEQRYESIKAVFAPYSAKMSPSVMNTIKTQIAINKDLSISQ